MTICQYGCGREAKYQMKNGKWCCESSFNKCPHLRKNNSEKIKQCHKDGKCRLGFDKNKNKWWLYKSEEEVKRIRKQQGETYSKRMQLGLVKKSFLGKKHTAKTKEKISYNATCRGGRCKLYMIYNFYENKEVKVQGTWEREYAKYLNDHNIKWVRGNIHKLKYMYDNDKTIHTYNPDFYLFDTDELIEIKGYYSDYDKLKMQQVIKYNPNIKISILFKNDLKHTLGLNIK